jgi:hypothetical protein
MADQGGRKLRIGLYDPCCDDLARHFLDDDETNTPKTRGIHECRVGSLATAIQEAVERWCDEEPT